MGKFQKYHREFLCNPSPLLPNVENIWEPEKPRLAGHY